MSVQFSHSVVSDSATPWIAARQASLSITISRSSLTQRPSSRWCHPAISSSVVPFSSCHQSLPASESFPMSQLFTWGGQSIGVSASTLVLPVNTQDWSPLGWTGWISLQSKGPASVFSKLQLKFHSVILLSSCADFMYNFWHGRIKKLSNYGIILKITFQHVEKYPFSIKGKNSKVYIWLNKTMHVVFYILISECMF